MRKVLHAYYDLAVSPASFDFFTFLMRRGLPRSA